MVFYFWKTRSGLRGAPFLKLFLGFIKSLWTAIWKSAAVFIIGYLLVYAVYFIFTINYPAEKQVSDTKYILTSFAGGYDNGINVCFPAAGAPIGRPMRCLAEVDIAMAGNAITKPFAQYMLGVLMVLQRSAGGNTAYFLGEVSSSGWWYYFPAVFLLKESIPSLILIFVALAIALWNILKSIRRKNLCNSLFDYIGMNFAEFAMISFVVLYWGYSMKSPLNIGVRHILPTFPFMYILASGAIKKWISGRTRNEGNFFKFSLKGAFVAVLAIWFLSESLFAYPYYLSYFNQFAGGTENGYKYATDSNYDWGQDLKRLGVWAKENNIGAIGIDYFGGGNLKHYVSSSVPWSSSMGNPKEKGIDWVAISVNTLEGAVGKLHAGVIRNPQDEYSWLPNPDKPYAKAGTSIFIYKL
ncbi:MAG: hypothetical protein NTW60_01360 [Candidatus Wolfebacteria bacterium]|nr:hypothetical protein [Candidatus Wolfebacteria bacterium]